MGKLNLTISLPEQDLNSLSFCNSSLKALEEWLQGLPLANTTETANQLYKALGEINRLKISAQQRIQMLNAILENFEHNQKNLARAFLNKPVMMSLQAKTMADAAEQLRTRFATSWLIVAVQQSQKRLSSANKTRAIIAESLHQAIYQYSEVVLNAQKLYRHPPEGVWLDLHYLFRISEQMKLSSRSFSLTSQADQSSSIRQCYMKAVILACLQSNQLSQKELSSIAKDIDSWTEHVKLGPMGHTPKINEHIIPCGDDLPPMYLSFYHGKKLSECRHINTKSLIKAIRGKQISLAAGLADHICQSLGPLPDRSVTRRPARGKVNIAPGLSDLHFYLANETGFERFIDVQVDNEKFLTRSKAFNMKNTEKRMEKLIDPWKESFDAERESKDHSAIDFEMVTPKAEHNAAVEAEKTREKEQYGTVEANMLDVSQTGYCLEWPKGIPDKIHAGDVIGVEDKQQNWQVAAVRWIKPEESRIGIELLNPTAIPAAIHLPKRDADSDTENRFIRALILPGMPSLGRGISIVLPKLPIRTRQKIELVTHNDIEMIQLGRRLSQSGSYMHYEFQRAKGITAKKEFKLSFDS